MSNRYDVVSPYKYKTQSGEEKTDWIRCGTMFQNEKGFSIRLRALPTQRDEKGEMVLLAYPPRDRERHSSSRTQPDDDIW